MRKHCKFMHLNMKIYFPICFLLSKLHINLYKKWLNSNTFNWFTFFRLANVFAVSICLNICLTNYCENIKWINVYVVFRFYLQAVSEIRIWNTILQMSSRWLELYVMFSLMMTLDKRWHGKVLLILFYVIWL